MEEEEFKFTDGCFFQEAPIRSPEAVIKEFYSVYDLEEVKITVWKMFKGVMTHDVQIFKLPEENGHLIFFLENFLLLNMAVHELSLRWEVTG